VDTTCATLGPTATVQQLLAANDAAATNFQYVTEPETDTNFEDVAIRQLGGFACYWAGGPIGDGGPEAQLTIDVVPNAATAFTGATPALTLTDDVHEGLVPSVPKWGDASFTDCEDSNGYAGCVFDIEIGAYWLHIVDDPANYPAKPYPLPAKLSSFLTATVATVKSLSPASPAWPVPVAAAMMPSSCATALTIAQVHSLLGAGAKPSAAGFDGVGAFNSSLLQAASLRECYWEGGYVKDALTGISVDMLPGSSWAWSAAQLPVTQKGENIAAVAGIGDAAFGYCDAEAQDCTVYAEVDDSWFSVDYASPNATLAQAETLAKDVVSAAT
jgi:hypothetical protein